MAGAGMLAGAMNALAGGGSFVTLIAAGVPSVAANVVHGGVGPTHRLGAGHDTRFKNS